jgi:hypothetical protein
MAISALRTEQLARTADGYAIASGHQAMNAISLTNVKTVPKKPPHPASLLQGSGVPLMLPSGGVLLLLRFSGYIVATDAFCALSERRFY